MSQHTSPPSLETIRRKVEVAERLSPAEGEFLLGRDVDLHAVGELADLDRRRRHAGVAFYNTNSHLNPTNVCLYRCPLCAYSCDSDDPRAYVMDRDEILRRGGSAAEAGCTELHIVGGIHPDKPFQWYVDILRMLHEAYPRLHLKAWTAMEIAHFATLTRQPIGSVLDDLIEAGLGSLPGGGAEIFDPEVRRQICPKKPGGDTWLEVHRTVHGAGLHTNATMLYGHVETPAQRIDHLVRLRELQDDTAGFQAFIPLAFHPDGTRFAHLKKVSALEDLRVMAVSRLMLDNFDHVKAYWISLGVETAQIALAYGADDIDGTVRHERIHHEAGSTAPEMLTVEALRGLIIEAGREPVERDTLYRRVHRDGTDWKIDDSVVS
ncbi:MAG: aminofutalosine synthase MqnE [Planctomycetes bacterium]|nr:aminofutalosine synthase MqnE [Planctomycetota bacterium]